jgi:hypothetical protein
MHNTNLTNAIIFTEIKLYTGNRHALAITLPPAVVRMNHKRLSRYQKYRIITIVDDITRPDGSLIIPSHIVLQACKNFERNILINIAFQTNQSCDIN